MAIGEVSVRVLPDSVDFWRSFRARTAGQANAEGRHQADEFRRGFEGRPIKVKAELDAARLRARLNELTRSQTVRVRADTSQARSELRQLDEATAQSSQGILQALLPLAPALAPLGAAAIGVGAALGTLAGSGVLAALGLKSAIEDATAVGDRAAASIGAVKSSLHGLEAVAAKAALPGLEASVAAITTEVPKLRSLVATEAATAGSVVAHLVRGITGGFGNFGPLIRTIGSDVDELAAHFEAFATGPGGARLAKTLTSDYAEVKPVLESVVRAVVDIARAASQGGLGILHVLGEVANLIDSFPTPVLTAIVDGFLLFRTIGVASTAINAVGRALDSAKTSAQTTAAIVRLSSLEATAARESEATAAAVAAQTIAEANLAEAEAARASALQIIQSREGVRATYSAEAQALLASADVEIASYRAVAEAASAAATQQAAASRAAAESVAGARAAAAGGSLVGTLAKTLGPIALVATALPLLSGLFGDNGQAAQDAASHIDGYTSALVANKGAIDGNVRSQVIANIGAKGLFDIAAKAGVSQSQLTDAVLTGGRALDIVTGKILAYQKAQSGLGGAKGTFTSGPVNALRELSAEFIAAAHAAEQQGAANDTVTASVRAHAAALHADVTSYQAAIDAAAKSTEQARAQTVAFQLENDAASLLSQALKGLAGQNLDVAQAQTSFDQSVHGTIDALTKNKDAILGHSKAALEDQQAVQGSVSAARQYADAVAKQTGSSAKAAAAYKGERDALLGRLKAQGVLTPAVRKYINTLFDVKGVSDYLSKHPTKLDADKTAASAKVRALRQEIDNIRQGKVPALTLDSAEAAIQILELQHKIDLLHGKNIYIHTITTGGPGNGGGGTQGNTPIAQATGGFISGPGTSTSDSIPAWLSNGEYVVNAKATSKHRHLLEAINRGVHGFAGGGAVGNAQQIAAALSSAFHLSGNQIAGILGNLKIESNFNPRAYNAREGAHGFAQWEGSRWTALQNYARSVGMSATSTQAQIGFLVKEMRGSGLIPQIKKMSDPARVAAFVDARYERSSGSTRKAREDAARSIARSGIATGATAGANSNAEKAAKAAAAKVAGHIQNLIGAIGQTPSGPKFDINQLGYKTIAAQISRARQALATSGLSPEKAKKFQDQITHWATVLQHQLVNLRVKIKDSDLKALGRAIGGTADDVRASFTSIITDLRHAGASKAQIGAVRRREAAVVAANNRYTAARDYSSSIKSTLAGTFDPTQYGSATDLIAGLSGQTSQNKAYAGELNKLRGETKGDKTLTAFINQLAASGQTATLQSLAGASKADLANVSKSLSAYNQSLNTGADAATQEAFNGKTAGQLHGDVDRMVKHTDAIVTKMVRAMSHLGHAVGASHKHAPHETARQIEQALRELETQLR